MITTLSSIHFRSLITPQKIFLIIALAFLGILPCVGASEFILYILSLSFIWAVVASYWNLLSGYSGILSLGNMAFFGLGAYVSSISSIDYDIPPWIAIFVGGLFTTVVVTILLGLPALRLRGIYIALLSLVFALTLPSIILMFPDITGGGVGLLNIPTFIKDIARKQAYYITFSFTIASLAILYLIIESKTGNAFVALRDSEDFATCLGVNRYREGLKTFAISAFITGMAGGVYAHTFGQISPAILGINMFLMVFTMWLLGGVGTFIGPIIGAFLITLGNEYLRVAGSLRLGFIGALIVITIMLFPGGIVEAIMKARSIAFKSRR